MDFGQKTPRRLFSVGFRCIEHQFVLLESLKDARRRSRSICCCCWLDFCNAFGSVRHKLIDFAIAHYKGSSQIRSVVRNLYNDLFGSVIVNGNVTNPFPYRIGVFQGDPLSVAIFNTVTCLLCEALSSDSLMSSGYKLSPSDDLTCEFSTFC